MSDDMKNEMCARLFFGCAFHLWEVRDAMMCATLCDCELDCRLNIERKLLLVLLSTYRPRSSQQAALNVIKLSDY